MSKRLVGFCIALALIPAATAAAQQKQEKPPTGRVAVVVDKSVLPEIKAGLDKYIAAVQARFPVTVEVKAGEWYAAKPDAIRDALKSDWAAKKNPPLVGAIMVGPLPVALRGDPNAIVAPTPLFYEDFDAQWKDPEGDSVYEGPVHDQKTNATEIWTAWWVPPVAADDRAGQAKALNTWLAKLDRYYQGQITGRDNLLCGFGNVTSVEIIEGWWAAWLDLLAGTPHKVQIYARHCEDKNQPKPENEKEFTSAEFWKALTSKTWQHVHIITHGRPDGWFWDEFAASVLKADPKHPNPGWTWVDVSSFKGCGGVIVTTSGCSNGNFRGLAMKPEYENSIGCQLLFSPDTPTVAYFGAATPQSTGPFAMYYSELTESLKADGDSYIGHGYYNMRNHDYCWGLTHFFFRGGDEKILSGDPFAKYRQTATAGQ